VIDDRIVAVPFIDFRVAPKRDRRRRRRADLGQPDGGDGAPDGEHPRQRSAARHAHEHRRLRFSPGLDCSVPDKRVVRTPTKPRKTSFFVPSQG
jgi:hypothetical protein